MQITSAEMSGLEPTVDPGKLMFDTFLERPPLESYLLRLYDDIETLKLRYKNINLDNVESLISKAKLLIDLDKDRAFKLLCEAKKELIKIKNNLKRIEKRKSKN